jgi:hypothetical protein
MRRVAVSIAGASVHRATELADQQVCAPCSCGLAKRDDITDRRQAPAAQDELDVPRPEIGAHVNAATGLATEDPTEDPPTRPIPPRGEVPGSARGLDVLPAVTIIWHPDLDRVGEIAPLTELLENEVAPLTSRFSSRSAIKLPPLRERRGDVGVLLVHFLREKMGDSELHRLQVLDQKSRDWLSVEDIAAVALSPLSENVRSLEGLAADLASAAMGTPRGDAHTVVATFLNRHPPDSGPVEKPAAPPTPSGQRDELTSDQLLAALEKYGLESHPRRTAAARFPLDFFAVAAQVPGASSSSRHLDSRTSPGN